MRTLLNQKSCGMSTLQLDHREVRPPERAERAVDERELLELVARVPGDEELGPVRVADHHAGGEHDLAHRLDVRRLDDVLQVEQVRAAGSISVSTIAKPPEDGAGDEVRREDRRVPAGELRRREVERDDRVHREHQRRRETREDQVRPLVAVPVAGRAAPAEREDAVDDRADVLAAASRSDRGASRGRGPGRCTRTASTWSGTSRPRTRPTSAGSGTAATSPISFGMREHPVREPQAAGVEQREQAGAHDGEDRHRLGGRG